MAGKLPEGVIWRTINGARVALNSKTGRVVAGAGGKLTGRQLTWYDDMGAMPETVKRAARILAKAAKRQQHEALNTPEKQALADSMLGAIAEARSKRGPIGNSGTERGDRNAMARLDAIESRLKAGKLTDVDRESIREPLERFGVRRRVVSAAEPWAATPDLYASDKYGYQGHMDMGPDAARRMHRNKAAKRRWNAEVNQNAEARAKGYNEWADAVRQAEKDGTIVKGLTKVSDEAAKLLGWPRTSAPQGGEAKAAAARAAARRAARRAARERED